MLFLAFTLGAIVAAVGGLAFLWAPGVPAVMLSVYIGYLRSQERRRFAYQMDRRQAEAAAQRLRERRPRRRPAVDEADPDEPEGPEAGTDTDPGLSALAADRRALVEQTDHAEWVDQQRERSRRPGQGGDSWDPVPVPLPTYVTAPVAPRLRRRGPRRPGHLELGPLQRRTGRRGAGGGRRGAGPGGPRRPGHRRRPHRRPPRRLRPPFPRARPHPLFDQYEDGDRPKAANE